MLEWIRARLGGAAQSVGQGLALVPNWLANQLWTVTAQFLVLAKRAFGANAVAYSCLRLLAQSVAEPPLLAFTERADGDREKLDRDHPLNALLARPNELMTGYEMLELIGYQLGICGRSFWWKERSFRGAPIALWPLRPDRVGFVYSVSDRPGERVLSGYSYTVPGTNEPRFVPRSEVLAVNLPDPSGESGGIVEGLGPLQVLAREIEADNEATTFVGSLLKNYAAPSVILKTKTPIRDKETAQRIKRNFIAQFGGTNRGDPAVVDADTEVEQLSFNMRELEFPDLRGISESRISAAIGVPAILVGLKVGLDRATYSNAEQAREYFAETTLSTYWRRLADQFSSDLASEFGPGLVCAFDMTEVRALAGQRQKAAEPIRDGFQRGAVTLNEYRQKVLGLEPHPAGDVFFIPTTVNPSETPLYRKPAPVIQPPAPRPALPPGQPAADDDQGPPTPDEEVRAQTKAGLPFRREYSARNSWQGYP